MMIQLRFREAPPRFPLPILENELPLVESLIEEKVRTLDEDGAPAEILKRLLEKLRPDTYVILNDDELDLLERLLREERERLNRRLEIVREFLGRIRWLRKPMRLKFDEAIQLTLHEYIPDLPNPQPRLPKLTPEEEMTKSLIERVSEAVREALWKSYVKEDES